MTRSHTAYVTSIDGELIALGSPWRIRVDVAEWLDLPPEAPELDELESAVAAVGVHEVESLWLFITVEETVFA